MNAAITPSVVEHEILLSELVANLEGDVGVLLGPDSRGAAASHDRFVRGVEFYDAFGADPTGAGLLLLVPSPDTLSVARITSIAADVAQSSTAALALKCRSEDVDVLSALAARTGVAIIRVMDHVSWRLFDSMLAQVFGERRHTEDTHRNTGVEPLFALANELAEVFGGSVAIEDLARRIIAYSSVPDQLIDRLRTQGILTRQVPDSPFNDDQYRTVLRSETPIRYPRLDDEEPRVAFAIRAGALPLGTIWAIDATGSTHLTPAQDTHIRTAASVAAAHLLNDIHARKTTQIPREARLRTLLDGTDVTGSELAELGHDEERGSQLLAFAPAQSAPATTLAQLRSTVQRHLSLHRPESVTVVRGDRVYALVAHQPALPVAQLIEPLLPIIDRLVGFDTRVALPGTAHHSGEISSHRQLADRLLDTAARHARTVTSRIVTIESVRTLLVLERVNAVFTAEPALRSPRLAALLDGDPRSAEILAAWCANFGNIARTARALGVHENTVRYRVRQAEEKYAVDVTTPDAILTTWLELRALLANEMRDA